MLACWVIALVSLCGSIFFVVSFYRDPGHSVEYIEGAWMILLSTAIPACLILTVVSVRNRFALPRFWQFYLNFPSVVCTTITIAVFAAHGTRGP
jgi:hypothetical protein